MMNTKNGVPVSPKFPMEVSEAWRKNVPTRDEVGVFLYGSQEELEAWRDLWEMNHEVDLFIEWIRTNKDNFTPETFNETVGEVMEEFSLDWW